MKEKSSLESVSVESPSWKEEAWEPHMPKVLHTLSNKLLPIVAFSDLGSRCCEDPTLREYFEKIRQAAKDSRELIIQLRQDVQQKNRSVPKGPE